MKHKIQVVVIGGGQAGLAASYHLGRQGVEHVVLEQAAAPANAWRNDRWDSFTLNTPNWAVRMPGVESPGESPDGFMPRTEVISYFEQYIDRFNLPVHHGVKVNSIEALESGKGYQVLTADATWQAQQVVMATGLYQTPRVPAFAANLSPRIAQYHSGNYRNPGALPTGAVLVVGSAQSGCQIAEEIYLSGRKVYLCTGSAGRVPRRYRGRDIFEWLDIIGFLDRTPEMLPSPQARFAGNPHVSGLDGGRTLNLHQFVRDGVTLAGHIRGGEGNTIHLAGDLHENLAKCDKIEEEILKRVDDTILRLGLKDAAETLPVLRDGYAEPELQEINLQAAGITSIIWAIGYRFDFSLIKLPVTDAAGFPIQNQGVTAHPGLYFVGLPWLDKMRTGLLIGVGESAEFIASQIGTRPMVGALAV
jgi:putative flavoprotein involved in K+ transport